MKIAILGPASDVYANGVAMILRGFQLHGNRATTVEGFVLAMIEDAVDAVLKLPGSDADQDEVARRFSYLTGRPVWRGVAEFSTVAPMQTWGRRAVRSGS